MRRDVVPRAFITLIFLLGAVILGMFYLRSEWAEFKELRASTERLQELSAEFDELIKNRDSLVNLINTVSKSDLEKIDKALPKGSRAGEVLVMLENLVGKNAMSLQSVGLTGSSDSGSKAGSQPSGSSASIISASRPTEPVKEFPIDLNTSGTYESFKKFLLDVESNLRITDVMSLNFSAMKDVSEKTIFTLKMKMYYQ